MPEENVEIVRRMYDAFHSGATVRWPTSTRTWSSMLPGPDRTAAKARGASS
jgi:hypothetical protein